MPFCSRLRPDVRDRQTSDRQTYTRRQTASSLNAPAYYGRGIISSDDDDDDDDTMIKDYYNLTKARCAIQMGIKLEKKSRDGSITPNH